MAAKKEEEEDDGGVDIKQVILKAKAGGKKVPFALAAKKGAGGVAFVANPKKRESETRPLILAIRKQKIDAAKLYFGALEVKGATVVLNANDKINKSVLKDFKVMLKDNGIMLKPVDSKASGDADEDDDE